MVAVPNALTLPYEHLFLGEKAGQWDVRCPEGGQVSVHTEVSPDKETSNEDGAMVVWPSPGRMVLAVADGVGGMPDGESASSLALTVLRDALRRRLALGADLREAIMSGFDRANREVLRRASGSATTLAVVEVDQGRLRSYHVGDSGVLVFGGRGRMRMQTISHSPVGYAVEAGVLDEQEAMEHEDRHLVSNVVGDRGMHVGVSYPLRLKRAVRQRVHRRDRAAASQGPPARSGLRSGGAVPRAHGRSPSGPARQAGRSHPGRVQTRRTPLSVRQTEGVSPSR